MGSISRCQGVKETTMRLLISALIYYQLLPSIANGQNNTASETAAADNTQKALITVAVLGGACIIAVVVAKLVDYCYDRHVSVSDDASDISEHTRDLIRLRLTISAFTRGGEKKKIQLTPKEDASAKQKKLIRIWSTKAKESRLIAEKIRAADMAKLQMTAVNKNNNNKDNSVTNSHSSSNKNNDIIIRVEAAACDGPLLTAESGTVVENGGTPAGVDKCTLHPPAASSEPHQLHFVGLQGAQTATKDGTCSDKSHPVGNSKNKAASSSGRRRSLSPSKLPARPASKVLYPSRPDLQEVTSSKRPSVHFGKGSVQVAATTHSPDTMSYSDERNLHGSSDIVDHSKNNDVSLLKSQESGVDSSGKSYSSKTPNNKVTPTKVKSLNPISPKVGSRDKNVDNASKSTSLDDKRLQYQGNNQVPLGDHSPPELHEKKWELPEDTGTSTFITCQDRRLSVTPESVSKTDVSSSSITVGVKVLQASRKGITKSNLLPTRTPAKAETESGRNLKSNILGAKMLVDKTINNKAILQTKMTEIKSESVGHENEISSLTSRQKRVNPLQVHKDNEMEAAKLDNGSSVVGVRPAATTSPGKNSAAEAQAGASTYTKAKLKIEDETEKQKLTIRLKSSKSENANKFKPISPSARDRLRSGKSDKRGDFSEDGLRVLKAAVTSPTHSTNADVVAAYTSAVNDIRLKARPKSSFIQNDSSSGVESKIAAAAAVYQKASEELQVHKAMVSWKKKTAIEAAGASAESNSASQATAPTGAPSVPAAQNLRQAMAIKKLRSQSAKI